MLNKFMSNQIPILLVTGFLGAGKTTFINKLLKDNPDKKISLILNEFGDIKLESQFVKKDGVGLVTELSNGCLCCVANVDLPRVIRYTLDQAPQTQQLIIEASGLSDPDPVRATLQSPDLSHLIKLDTTVVIVDALNFATTAPKHPLVMSQIADADLVVIAKSSTLSSDDLSDFTKKIGSIGTGTTTLVWEQIVDSSIFFEPPITHLQKMSSADHQHEHVDTYIYQSKIPVNLQALLEYLKNLPTDILRVKGYVDVNGSRYLIQKVGNHLDVRLGVVNTEDINKVVILFLGSQLDQEALNAKLSHLNIK